MQKFKFLIKLTAMCIMSALLIVLMAMIIPVFLILAIPFIGYGAYRLYETTLEMDKDRTIIDYEDKP